jgi:hypothetical protein
MNYSLANMQHTATLGDPMEVIEAALSNIPTDIHGDFLPEPLLNMYLNMEKAPGLASFFLTVIGIEHNKKDSEENLEQRLIAHLAEASKDEGPFVRTEEQIQRLLESKESEALRKEQDKEYEESLQVDRAIQENKERLQKEEEQRQKKRKREEEEEEQRLIALKKQESIPIEQRRKLFADRFETLFKKNKTSAVS